MRTFGVSARPANPCLVSYSNLAPVRPASPQYTHPSATLHHLQSNPGRNQQLSGNQNRRHEPRSAVFPLSRQPGKAGPTDVHPVLSAYRSTCTAMYAASCTRSTGYPFRIRTAGIQ